CGWLEDCSTTHHRAVGLRWVSLRSTHPTKSPAAGRGPRLEVFWRDRRQLLEECDHRPDFLIRHFDAREARHAGHVDAVLDHPEKLARLTRADDLLEIGRIGAQPFRQFCPFDARRAMAVGAAA